MKLSNLQPNSDTDFTPDLIDQLVADWSRERPDLDVLAMGIVGRIIHLATGLKVRANEALEPFGLSYTDLDLLATLRRSGEPFKLTPTELMNAILLSSGAMTAALGRLEKRDLITRQPGAKDTDRRVKAVALSNKGRVLVDKAIAARFAEANDAISRLSEPQKQLLENTLRDLLNAI